MTEKTKRPGGRHGPPIHHKEGPYFLTPEVQTILLSALRSGVHFETAAALAGIARDTLWRWLREGRRAPDGPCGVFVKEADRALAEAEAGHVRNIRDAGQEDWKASAWILQNRYPERWGNKVKVETTDEQPEETDLDGYSTEELLELHAGIEAVKRKLTKRKLHTPTEKSTH